MVRLLREQVAEQILSDSIGRIETITARVSTCYNYANNSEILLCLCCCCCCLHSQDADIKKPRAEQIHSGSRFASVWLLLSLEEKTCKDEAIRGKYPKGPL